jgi:hypothetical protein
MLPGTHVTMHREISAYGGSRPCEGTRARLGVCDPACALFPAPRAIRQPAREESGLGCEHGPRRAPRSHVGDYSDPARRASRLGRDGSPGDRSLLQLGSECVFQPQVSSAYALGKGESRGALPRNVRGPRRLSSFVEKEGKRSSVGNSRMHRRLGHPDWCNGLPITGTGTKYDDAHFATDTFPYFTGYHRTAIVNR